MDHFYVWWRANQAKSAGLHQKLQNYREGKEAVICRGESSVESLVDKTCILEGWWSFWGLHCFGDQFYHSAVANGYWRCLFKLYQTVKLGSLGAHTKRSNGHLSGVHDGSLGTSSWTPSRGVHSLGGAYLVLNLLCIFYLSLIALFF